MGQWTRNRRPLCPRRSKGFAMDIDADAMAET
jgi:hypothetical protein